MGLGTYQLEASILLRSIVRSHAKINRVPSCMGLQRTDTYVCWSGIFLERLTRTWQHWLHLEGNPLSLPPTFLNILRESLEICKDNLPHTKSSRRNVQCHQHEVFGRNLGKLVSPPAGSLAGRPGQTRVRGCS